MVELYKYRLYCEDEESYVHAWGESEPDKCPNNTDHVITSGSIAIVEKRAPMVVDMNTEKDTEGRPIFTPTFREYTYKGTNLVPKQRGYSFDADPGSGIATTTFNDILVTSEIQLQGGMYWICNDDPKTDVDKRDYIEFSVIDKDDKYMPGLFAMLGLTPGVDVLELNKFIINNRVKKGDANNGYFHHPLKTVDGSSLVVSGLYMRAGYTSYGNAAIDLYVEMVSYEY